MAGTTEKPRNGYVTVATVRGRNQARRLASKLAAAKIDSVVRDARESSHPEGNLFSVGEVKVQVNRADVQAALEALRSGAGPGDAHSLKPSPVDEMRRVALGGGGWKKAVLEIGVLVGAAALLGVFLFS